MLASTRNQRSPSPRRSSPSSTRRVCFSDTTITENTDKTSPSSLDMVPAVHGEDLRLTLPGAHSSSATDGFWDRYSPLHYRPDFASADSSTASLFGRPPPSTTALFADRAPICSQCLLAKTRSREAQTFFHFSSAYVTSPRRSPYCVRPPFGSGWPPAFEQPSSEDIFQSAPPAHDSGTSGLSWLRNIGVGMLVAAMLTVALTLALNMDLQDSDVVPWPTSPMPGEMEKIGSGRIAIPVRPIIVPPGRRPGATFRPISEAHNVTRAPRLAARAEPSRLPWPYADNKTLSHQCGSHFYTYCYEGGNDVYYSATLRTCTSTEAGSVHVCNRGANRFTSMDSCLASCVHVANGRPQDRCYEATLFATCSWQDAAETWWYYDGTVCAQWNFPLGNCPLQDGRLFRTRLDCDQACVHREGGDGERRRCDAPDAATCTTRQLKYPYFASMRESGPARCVSASSHELNAHRCLVGPNRFDSVASCERACVDS
ncbi:hypothetical protein HPB49_019862 [Dermacentor silvarum]|uniref:Uncharacterized protein n=1 Tax=Dermacentor silvarum TaxID=543639 RepID=A0ACB8CH49_DERSI|nr:hypothetical protein HPB49_019862 [Dermacentor silvarum]